MRINSFSAYLTVLAVFFSALLSLLAAGCSGKEPAAPQNEAEEPAGYSGFMELKAGMWSEMNVKSGTATSIMRTELIENSPSESRFQVTTNAGGRETVSQIWIDRNTGRPTRYAVKSGNTVSCPDASKVPKSQLPANADLYPENPSLETGMYSSEGKKVSYVKFAKSGTETWVSSEVPFGVVKVVSAGKTIMSLHDFGIIGAKSMISEKEISGCTGAADEDSDNLAEESREETADTSSSESRKTDSTTETAPETGSEQAEEDDKTVATSVTYKGEESSLPCAQCKGMPAAALKACLAACS
jgi:hypothetical protein